jgi:transcription initiation factor TFIID subunit 1
MSKTNKSLKPLQVKYYEDAAAELEAMSKSVRQRYEVAKYIYEELLLASWNLTGDFIDIHKKGEGNGMMKLTGLGDPSGIGEGFSFLREADSKPSKKASTASMSQTAEMKKITGLFSLIFQFKDKNYLPMTNLYPFSICFGNHRYRG